MDLDHILTLTNNQVSRHLVDAFAKHLISAGEIWNYKGSRRH